jgi:hypothetical protein
MSYDWVKPGAEVIFRSSGWGNRFGRTAKIDKVYKTGNFTVEGDKQQYRPMRDYARASGRRAYHSDSLYPLTDEVRQEVIRERRMREAKTIVAAESERLDKLSRSESDELIAEADAIRARASSPVGG